MTLPNSGNALTMSDLVKNPTLRAYLSNVRDWHGYVRFLGLPDRRDNPDVLIDRLFVEPLLTHRHVSPDEDPSSWFDETETVFDTLRHARPVVLLGDPGTGKSTLLNYLVWLLARPTGDIWTEQMGEWLLPIPMVLRELNLRGVTRFGGLLDAFLDHPMSEPLRGSEYLDQALGEGKALVLLDGIDELGSSPARQELRKAVFDGFDQYPRCRWLLSSRVVGYEEAPFDRRQNLLKQRWSSAETHTDSLKISARLENDGLLTRPDLFELTTFRQDVSAGFAITRYIAPFDDRRIEAFARNWYVQREAAATRAGEDAAHLVRAVHGDDAILRLARIPNLLTMIALIHRIEATLPHGRALLYDRIAEAYLELIDKFRGVYSGSYSLPQKKRWLARVAYEMQKRRSTGHASTNEAGESDLLVESPKVITWLREEMNQGGATEEISAGEFLDFIGRRSGLFLPRGEGRYAFVHLSFQEYFAAVALEREVTGISWARRELTQLGMNREILGKWAEQSALRETFAFLFELLAPKEDWHGDLMDAVFGEHFCRLETNVSDAAATNLARLLARLAINQRSGISRESECDAITAAVRIALQHEKQPDFLPPSPGILQELLSDNLTWNDKVLEIICEQSKRLNIQFLSLVQTQISDIKSLANLTELNALYLKQTQVSDIGPLTNLTALTSLDLGQTQVSDIGPLTNLTALTSLDLGQTQVSDIGPLTKLGMLNFLVLWGTKVSDLQPLADLVALEFLFLLKMQISDLSPLKNLRALQYLALWDTQISDLSPLSGLTALESLDLGATHITDLGPLAYLRGLKSLDLWRAKVADLSPLANLRGITSLNLRETQVADLNPLADFSALKSLDLMQTQVSDLRPLTRLVALESLDLWGTDISDIRSLANLKALESLDLRKTKVSKFAIEELRRALPNCKIFY